MILLSENIALFDNTTVGCLQNFEARLSVDNSKPIFHKARLVPFAMKRKVETSLLDLEQKGIIQKVEYSDWAAPIVPVVKPSGALRLCGDYKVTINKAVKVDTYPLPLVNELFANLAGGQKIYKTRLVGSLPPDKITPGFAEVHDNKYAPRTVRIFAAFPTVSVPVLAYFSVQWRRYSKVSLV